MQWLMMHTQALESDCSKFKPQTPFIGQIIYLQEASLSPSLNGENACCSVLLIQTLRNVVFTIIIEER